MREQGTRRFRRLPVILAACLCLLTGGPASLAEGDSFMMRDPTLQRGPGFFGFFQNRRPQPPPQQRPRVAPAPKRPAAVARESRQLPKTEIRHTVLVLGDSLARSLAGGLAEALGDRPDVAVLDKAQAQAGLLQSDFREWSAGVEAELGAERKPAAGVILIGAQDRGPIREGETVHEPLSPRWLALYRERTDAMIRLFAGRRVPLLWVGLPPGQNPGFSAAAVSLNALIRERAELGGAEYVDLWPGFVDAENRYAATGPDFAGQIRRLRLADGLHFTAAGARKAAHFVDLPLRRLLDAATPAPLETAPPDPAALAGRTLEPAEIERLIDRMVSGAPEAIALSPALRARPEAGPVLPLDGPQPGEARLVSSLSEARGTGEAAFRLDRIYRDGEVPESVPGRLDDHRWPRPGG